MTPQAAARILYDAAARGEHFPEQLKGQLDIAGGYRAQQSVLALHLAAGQIYLADPGSHSLAITAGDNLLLDDDGPGQCPAGEVRDEAVDAAQQRRLARPGLADNQAQLTLGPLEVAAVEPGPRPAGGA